MTRNTWSYRSLLRSSKRWGRESFDSEEYDRDQVKDYLQRMSKRIVPRSGWFLVAHASILLLYTTIFILALFSIPLIRSSSTSVKDNRNGRTSPLLSPGIRHVVRTVGYNFQGTSPFKGPPISEIDAQWSATLNNPHELRVSQPQMISSNLSSIQLSDGSGDYLVSPIVYHMLHCLYSLYKYVHPEFYGEDPSGAVWVVEHTEHCVENLRQFVMCHAGTGVSTFKWLASRKIPWPVLNAEETCIDWDYFEGWVRDRSIAMEEVVNMQTKDGKPMLAHPKLGAITPDDYVDKNMQGPKGAHKLPPEIAAEVDN